MPRTSHLWLFILLTALYGCASAPPVKLATPLGETEKAAAVVIFLPQSEVQVDDVDVANAGGGLIGVLIETAIESAKTRNRQEAITPLRDALLDFDYESRLIEAMRQSLPTSLVQADASFKLVRNEDEWLAHLAAVVPANVMRVDARYAFEQEFEVAYVHAIATLTRYTVVPDPSSERRGKRRRGKSKDDPNKPLQLHVGSYYSQHVTRQVTERLRGRDGMAPFEIDAQAWAADSADAARRGFAAGLDEVADLIRRDGERSLPPVSESAAKVLLANSAFQPLLVQAHWLERRNGRSLVEFRNTLFWIDDRQIVER